MAAHSSLMVRPGPETAHRASQPVGRSISSRETTPRPGASRAASRRSSPSRKARRITGPFFTGPGIFMVKETTGQLRQSSSSRWRRALASRASSISINVTSCSMAGSTSVSIVDHLCLPLDGGADGRAPGAGEEVIGACGHPVPDVFRLAVVDGLAHRAGADGGPVPGQAGDLDALDPRFRQLLAHDLVIETGDMAAALLPT